MMVGRFNYYTRVPPESFPQTPPGNPSGLSPLAVIEPAYSVTRGQKTIMASRVEYMNAKLRIGQPDPPIVKPVQWPQSRAQADPRLGYTFSRLDLLRQGEGANS